MIYENVKKVHGPYKRKDGRRHVVIVFGDNKRKTVSYPKFLVENRLGRFLDMDKETIDHINGDFTDDSEDNLQVLTRKENSAKSARRRGAIKGRCKLCDAEFVLSRAQVSGGHKEKSGPFCSRTCSGRYGAMIQNGLIGELGREPVSVGYYRNDDEERTKI